MKESINKNFIQDYVQEEFNKQDSLILRFGSSFILVIIVSAFIVSIFVQMPSTIKCDGVIRNEGIVEITSQYDGLLQNRIAIVENNVFKGERLLEIKGIDTSHIIYAPCKGRIYFLKSDTSDYIVSKGDVIGYIDSGSTQRVIEFVIPSGADNSIKVGQLVDITHSQNIGEKSTLRYIGHIKSINNSDCPGNLKLAIVDISKLDNLIFESGPESLANINISCKVHLDSRSVFSQLFNN